MRIDTPAGALGEIPGRRTKYSKTFDMGNNRRQVRCGLRPVHWANGGSLDDIDLNWLTAGPNYILQTAPYNLQINPDQLRINYARDDGGSVDVRLTQINDTPINQLTTNNNPRLDGHRVWLDDFITGISLYWEAQDNGFAFQKLITQPIGNVSFTMQITHDNNTDILIENRAIGRDNYNGISDPSRTSPRDFRRQLITTETVSNVIDNGDGTETYTLRQEWQQLVAAVDHLTRVKTPTDQCIYPVRMHVLVNETLGSTADDGDEQDATTWNAHNSANTLRAGRSSANTFHGGFHFAGVSVPAGATIDSPTTLDINVNTVFGTPQVTAFAEDTDNASAISGTNRPSQWTKTTASTDATTPLSSTGAQTIDIQAIIQEIVDRPGWAAEQAINLGLFHDGGGTGYQESIILDTATWGTQDFAELTINYTEGSSVAPLAHHMGMMANA